MKFFEKKENLVIAALICVAVGFILHNMYMTQNMERDIVINDKIENINAQSQRVLTADMQSMNTSKRKSVNSPKGPSVNAPKGPSVNTQKGSSVSTPKDPPVNAPKSSSVSRVGDGIIETDQEETDDLRETLSELKKICDTCSQDTNICSPECQEMRQYCEYLGYENAPFVPCTASEKHFSKIESPVGFNFDEQIDGVIYQNDFRPQKKYEITGPVSGGSMVAAVNY